MNRSDCSLVVTTNTADRVSKNKSGQMTNNLVIAFTKLENSNHLK